MPEEQKGLGTIDVSSAAITSIVNDAVLSCYGVVGMVPKNLVTGVVEALSPDSKRGVEVRVVNGQICINLYVVIEYGTRIVAVAHSIMNVVKFNVEKMVGVPVAEVNVHVQELRVSNVD